MKHLNYCFTLVWLMAFSTAVSAQKKGKADAEQDIKAAINHFFEAMEKGDTALLQRVCAPGMQLQTYMADKEGVMQVYTVPFEDFARMVSTPKEDKYEERIKFGAIEYEQSLAVVWTPYTFFINGKRSHCGTNSFQLIKTGKGWKIQYIIDTRRKNGCK